jgi:hypothetical protein
VIVSNVAVVVYRIPPFSVHSQRRLYQTNENFTSLTHIDVYVIGLQLLQGDEGNNVNTTKDWTRSKVTCSAKANASSWSESKSVVRTAVVDAFAVACEPGFEGPIDRVEQIFRGAASASARAIADAQAECVSQGNAFGCATATATAKAWARATAEAWAQAVATATNNCGCLTDADAFAFGQASTFIDLIADVYARAEVHACVEGNAESKAGAWSNCFATAFTKIFAKVRNQDLLFLLHRSL